MKTRTSIFITSIAVSGFALCLSAGAAPPTAEHLPLCDNDRAQAVVVSSTANVGNRQIAVTSGRRVKRRTAVFKIEVEDGNGIWSDARSAAGALLTFENEEDARAKLAVLHPVMVQMEKYAGGKRTRVVRVFRTDKEWNDGTPPT